MRVTVATFSLLGASLASCAGTTADSVITRDSAGTRIVLSPETDRTFAEIDPNPAWTIGGADAVGHDQLGGVQNVYVDRRNRVWIADPLSNQIRIFLDDGSHWKTVGRQGQGPGEFIALRLLGAQVGDTVLVADASNGRITVLDPDGGVIRTEQVALDNVETPRFTRVFPDGSLLGQVPRSAMAASLVPGQVLIDSVFLVRVRRDPLASQPYAAAAGPLWIWTGREQSLMPFTTNASFAVLGDTVMLVSGPAFRVYGFVRGQLVEAFGVSRPQRPVGDEDIQSYRDIANYLPEARRPSYLDALTHPRRPAVLPAYDGVLSAPHGYVWARIYQSDYSAWRFDVFDPNGAFVGSVQLPAGFEPFVIGEGNIIGVWRDEGGGESVRKYRYDRTN